MKLMYKGYIGQVTYDNEAKIFHGEIINLKSIITFSTDPSKPLGVVGQGKSEAELEAALRDSVEDYLEWCKKRGEMPDKPNFK